MRLPGRVYVAETNGQIHARFPFIAHIDPATEAAQTFGDLSSAGIAQLVSV